MHRLTRAPAAGAVAAACAAALPGQGQRLHRLDRAGKIPADFATPVSESQPGSPFQTRGVIDPDISPDATKVAYGYNFQYTEYDPYCGYYGGCSVGKVVVGTGYRARPRR